MKKWTPRLAAIAAMAWAGSAQAANLVTNGSFEDGNFVGGSFGFPLAQQVNSGDAATLPGWTTNTTELAWFRSGQAGLTTTDGDKALDLTGFGDTQGTYAGVSQSIATVIGSLYRLTFLGGTYLYNGASPTGAGLRASAGLTSGDFYFTPTGLAEGTWQPFQLDFVASASSTTIGFLGITDSLSDPPYIGLDKVAVELLSSPGAVPEPATWALTILGFGLIGAAMRKPRQVVTVRYDLA